MRAQQLSKPRIIWTACVALGVLTSGAAGAQSDSCSPPPPWSKDDIDSGRPVAEVEACLKVQAWESRNLNIAVNAAVAGIVSQCEVRVIFGTGPAGSGSRTKAQQRINASDREALDQALDDITWARGCAGR